MPPESRVLLRQVSPATYKLYIPELGTRRPITAILPCPERIEVAWHRDALGVWELLDQHGNNRYGHAPQESLWQVREYQRAMHYPGAHEAFYDEVTDA